MMRTRTLHSRPPLAAFLLATLILALPLPVHAEWDWYSGGIVPYSGRNTSGSIAEQVQKALDDGLDWVVLVGRQDEGYYAGLQDIVQEYGLSVPRLTPLVGTEWSTPESNGRGDLLLFGIDPRAPVSADSLRRATAWAESHLGISVASSLDSVSIGEQSRWDMPTAFLGLRDGIWSRACLPGEAWDEILSSGRRITLLGGDTRSSDRIGSRVFAWAQQNRDGDIVAAVRRGAVYVADQPGMRMHVQVNGRGPGETTLIGRDAYVRLQTSAPTPIHRIELIADGKVVWSAYPEATFWEGRFFLPLSNHSYVRTNVYVESPDGGSALLAAANPIFIVSEMGDVGSELPVSGPEPVLEDAGYVDVDGALQAAANLPLGPRLQVLGEFLRDLHTQYATVRVLQDREDLVSDRHLWRLAKNSSADIRLGALYALVARAPSELPDLLLSALKDSDAVVRRYAARILAQFTEGLERPRIDWILDEPDALTQGYLIRAMTPVRYHAGLTSALVGLADSPHRSVSAAAVNKLVLLGTSSYKVIQTLLDSARAGRASALEPIARIRDPRVIDDLEELHLRAPPGPLRRSSFIALAQMGAPYPDRKRLTCPLLDPHPDIDGVVGEDEWREAAEIGAFADDSDAGEPSGKLTARIGAGGGDLYFAFSCEMPDSAAARISAWRRDSDSDPRTGTEAGRLEITLSPGEEAGPPFVLSVDPMGVFQDRHGEDRDWNPVWSTASNRTLGRWTVEGRIPLEAFGIVPGEIQPVLRFNLAYVEAGSVHRRWSWSVTYGDPYDPLRYGDLLLPPFDARSSQ